MKRATQQCWQHHLVRKQHFVIGWDSLQEGEKTPLKEGKGKKRKATPLQEGSCKSKPSAMWRRDGALVAKSKAGEEDDLEEAMGFKPKQTKTMKKPAARKPAEPAAASSGCRRLWEKVRVTEANKPKPRAYITGCHAREKKLRLICEVSIARTNQYKKYHLFDQGAAGAKRPFERRGNSAQGKVVQTISYQNMSSCKKGMSVPVRSLFRRENPCNEGYNYAG